MAPRRAESAQCKKEDSTVKIDSSVKSVAPKPAGGASKPATGTKSNASAAAGPQVELSSVATHLQQAGQVGATSDTFNTERVAEIRQAIAEGRFQINADRIADGLINSVRDMLAQNRRPA
jgi:negative regulator of flagellin synthesis FlgM